MDQIVAPKGETKNAIYTQLVAAKREVEAMRLQMAQMERTLNVLRGNAPRSETHPPHPANVVAGATFKREPLFVAFKSQKDFAFRYRERAAAALQRPVAVSQLVKAPGNREVYVVY